VSLRVGPGVVRVRGYRRRDGTWVRSHRRRAPARSSRAKKVAAGVVLAVTIGGGTVTLAISRGSAQIPRGGSPARPPAKTEVRVKADSDRVAARLRAKGYRVNLRMEHDDDCAAHSYGTVQDFFRLTPCSSLSRAVFELRDKHRNVTLVAISWVDMPNAAAARQYKALVDRDGPATLPTLTRERAVSERSLRRPALHFEPPEPDRAKYASSTRQLDSWHSRTQ
jgi:hypothetical protein